MAKMTRRGFLGSAAAAASLKAAPMIKTSSGRRILTLVYDKSLGMMRAIERVVP